MHKSFFFKNSNLTAKNLRQLRKQQNLLPKELTAQMQLLGVDINHRLISKIELNQRSAAVCRVYCAVLGKDRVKALPTPGSLSSATAAPRYAAPCFTMESPSPVPPPARLLSTR